MKILTTIWHFRKKKLFSIKISELNFALIKIL